MADVVTVRNTAGRLGVITLSGDVDVATDDAVQGAVTSAAAQRLDGVAVDLSAVTFMDYTGINALVRLSHWARSTGKPLILAAVPSNVARLLRILALHDEFVMAPSIDAAMNTLHLTQSDRTRPAAAACGSVEDGSRR
jgi:anti-sigma B factor antagonist